jgi:hypothetical protein
MWPFKRKKKIYVEAEVIEPKELSLDMVVNMELRNLSNQDLTLKSTRMALRNVVKRYKEMGYTFKHNFS